VPLLHPHPVTYPGNLMLMGEADWHWQDFNAAYTFCPHHAVTARAMRFKSEDGSRRRTISNLHTTTCSNAGTCRIRRLIYICKPATGNDFCGSHYTLL